MRNGKRKTIAPGIYLEGDRYCVIARIRSGHKELRSPELRFPYPETSLATVRAVWFEEKAKLEKLREKRTVAGTLRADVRTYLRAATLSDKRRDEREHQLLWWCTEFGDRRRHALQPLELKLHLNSLRHPRTGLPASKSTRNHYRMALYNLFTVLDGKNAPNPLRDVPRARGLRPDQEPRRDQPYSFIHLLFSLMRPSRTKARLMVLAYAPVTTAQLQRMTPADLDLAAGVMYCAHRNKGDGAPRKTKPLTAAAIAAFQMFADWQCWNHPAPSNSSIGRSLKLARDKALASVRTLPAADRARRFPDLDLARAATMRPYDLRHSFGSATVRATGDTTAAAALLDHADLRTTLRYVHGAISDHLHRANTALDAAFTAAAPPDA